MKPVTTLLAVLLFAAAALADPAPPELETLKHFIGKWDVAVTENADVKGTATAQWIVDGRFLQQTWSIDIAGGDPSKISGTTLMTYDAKKRTFRSWQFLSTGSTIEGEGVWDAAARAFTWTVRDPASGNTVVSKTAFPEDGVEKWTIVTTNREGETKSSFGGTNTRRKE